MTPAGILVTIAPTLAQASIALNKLQSLGLDLERSIVPEEAHAELERARPNSPPEIELHGLTYQYRPDAEGKSFGIGPIDLVISPGELVFLVGGNGSGKTTLAKIITGLYSPSNGALLADGSPVVDQNRDSYRQIFLHAVFADSFLFPAISGSNSLGMADQADRYLSWLKMDQVVSLKDGRWSSLRLSQGQRKRLALIDAFLMDRPVYVFDEWAAEQDPEFREMFYHELLPALNQHGKTVIVISHDDRSTITWPTVWSGSTMARLSMRNQTAR